MLDDCEPDQARRRQLEGLLHEGLMQRLRDADGYLAGIHVGLGSLRRLLELVELTYRERGRHTEAGRRIARLQYVYESLQRSADSGSRSERAALLLAVRVPLAHLVDELSDAGPQAPGVNRGLLAQLAADLHSVLRRMTTLQQLRADLVPLEDFRRRTFVGKRDLDELVDRYRGIASKLGLADAAVLETPAGARTLSANAARELLAVQRHLEMLHARIFGGRPCSLTSSIVQADFAEVTLLSALVQLVKNGHECLTHARGIYREALDLIGHGDKLPGLEELDRDEAAPLCAPLPRGSAESCPPGVEPVLSPTPSLRELIVRLSGSSAVPLLVDD